jgi:hypothetical protein
VSPRFGGSDKRDDHQDGGNDAQQEIGRLKLLPLEQLAAELIGAAFPPVDASERGRVSVHDMALKLVPGSLRLPQEAVWELDELVGEGVQYLEHAGLAQCTVVGTDRRLQWVLTRLGRSNGA